MQQQQRGPSMGREVTAEEQQRMDELLRVLLGFALCPLYCSM